MHQCGEGGLGVGVWDWLGIDKGPRSRACPCEGTCPSTWGGSWG